MAAVHFFVLCQLALLAVGQTQDISRQLGDALRRRNVGSLQEGARSLVDVEESIFPTVQALPKNQHGRLDRAQVAYTAERYFARELGWRIEGLGGVFSGLGARQTSSGGWLTEELSTAVDAYRGGRGLSAGDLAIVISVIENALLQEPLSSRSGTRVTRQRETCSARKDALQRLGQPNTGRMPLRSLYAGAGSDAEADISISDLESPSFLRAAGAVEESDDPQLLIANYMQLPSNCVASSGSTISVCCVSSCEGIVRQIEETLQGPVVSPERMLHVIAGLSSNPIPQPLAKQLLVIAKKHEGVVPLHSTDFSEWIHYVFPTDCPRPIEVQADISHQVDDAVEAVQKLREDAAARAATPYTAERMIADYAGTAAPREAVSTQAAPAQGAPKDKAPAPEFSYQNMGRIAVLGLLAFAMLRTVVSTCRRAGGAMRGEEQDMKAAKKLG